MSDYVIHPLTDRGDGVPVTAGGEVRRLTSYPTEFAGAAQVLRAYDERGWIHPSTHLHDGSDPDAAIASVLAHPEVVEVHSRNPAYGCYMFRITRS